MIPNYSHSVLQSCSGSNASALRFKVSRKRTSAEGLECNHDDTGPTLQTPINSSHLILVDSQPWQIMGKSYRFLCFQKNASDYVFDFKSNDFQIIRWSPTATYHSTECFRKEKWQHRRKVNAGSILIIHVQKEVIRLHFLFQQKPLLLALVMQSGDKIPCIFLLNSQQIILGNVWQDPFSST